MVRIQRRVSKKRYLNSKRTYEYERITLEIPKKHHETVRPFLERDFDFKVEAEKDHININLVPAKTFRQATNTPQKTCPESLPDT